MIGKVTAAMKAALRDIHAGRVSAKPSTRNLVRAGLLDPDPTLPKDHASLVVEVTMRSVEGRTSYVLTEAALRIIGAEPLHGPDDDRDRSPQKGNPST